jgi:hypothetical protein
MIIISKFLRFLIRQYENGMFRWRVLKLKCLYPGILIDFKTKIEKNCSIICVKGGTLRISNSNIGFGTHIKVDSGATIIGNYSRNRLLNCRNGRDQRSGS